MKGKALKLLRKKGGRRSELNGKGERGPVRKEINLTLHPRTKKERGRESLPPDRTRERGRRAGRRGFSAPYERGRKPRARHRLKKRRRRGLKSCGNKDGTSAGEGGAWPPAYWQGWAHTPRKKSSPKGRKTTQHERRRKRSEGIIGKKPLSSLPSAKALQDGSRDY